jgi:hypothetical protein
MSDSAQTAAASLREFMQELRDTARDQMVAAWQLHIEQLQEQLAVGWPERVEWIFEERFRGLQTRLEEYYRSTIGDRVTAALLEARGDIRREFAEKINQALRRLRVFESDAQWAAAVLDATESFCDRTALFTLNGLNLHLAAVRGMGPPGDLEDVPLSVAPAFASAIATADTMVALRTASEMSPQLAAVFGEDPALRFHLFPIATRERVAAVLYADAAVLVEASALELLCGVAGIVLDSLSGRPSARDDLVRIAASERRGAGIGAWFQLSRADQELHLRAQRFARVQVAEMRLYKSDAVKEGRAKRDLYSLLKADIDSTRELFQRDYLTATPTMVDYFHLELVRTLANEEAELLGKDYPGPLA